LIVAAALRLYDPDLKPLHSDEGVNGFLVARLFHEGLYRYDPANYHGPTLYYLALIASTFNSLFFGKYGLSTVAIRLVPVLSGIGAVWLILSLRRQLGPIGALAAAALVALSPGAVYFSRDFIHEAPFVFFTLALVVASLRYYETSRPVYFLLASATAALLLATKETAVISIAVLVMGILCARIRDRPSFPSIPIVAAAGLLFLGLIVLFYSSFFSNPKGVSDAIAAFRFWARTSHQPAHRYAWYQYLSWLAREELPILVLGAMGVALAAWRRSSDRFAVFTGLWAFGSLCAYSLVPYKTPWLALNFIVPLAIAGGYAIQMSYRRRILAVALIIPALAISAYETIRLNFFHYDDDRYPYAYSQTSRGFLRLVAEINSIAARAGTGKETTVAVMSPEYWPLPWYLRDYANVGYYDRPVNADEAIVIGEEKQEPELRQLLGDKYQRIGSYALRPGVDLVLFVRRDSGTLAARPSLLTLPVILAAHGQGARRYRWSCHGCQPQSRPCSRAT